MHPLIPPYIHQEEPAGRDEHYDGSAACGPACMGMLARIVGYGSHLNDAALLDSLAGIGGTTKELGTELAGLGAMARALDREMAIRAGFDLRFTRDALRQGALVIANGEFYAMAPHADPSKSEGHYVLVYGMDPLGRFLVHDPADPRVEAVSETELERFLREHWAGGFQVSVSLSPRLSPRERLLLASAPAPLKMAQAGR